MPENSLKLRKVAIETLESSLDEIVAIWSLILREFSAFDGVRDGDEL